MSEIDNLCYSYEQSIKAAMRFAWALAVVEGKQRLGGEA